MSRSEPSEPIEDDDGDDLYGDLDAFAAMAGTTAASTDPSRSPRTSGKAKTPRGHGTRGPKPGSPKARNGGLALKAKKMRDDPDYYKRISKMGGQAIRDGYGRAYYEVVGARGGLTTHAKHPEHLRRIGPANAAKGAAARWKGHVKARKDE